MNKKFVIPLVVMFAIGLVVAGAMFYQQYIVNVQVTQYIIVDGAVTQNVDCIAGKSCLGSDVTISNTGDTEKTIQLSSTKYDNIETTLVSGLRLSKKNVVFGSAPWTEVTSDTDVIINYTLVGDEFSAEVASGAEGGYELIYYKDKSDRFNDPAKAIGVNSVDKNLPYPNDENADEYNYCTMGEYSTCHGAKIWYVPSNAINGDRTLDWSRASDFYFETSLIQFNAEGQIVVYPHSNITFKPLFEVNQFLKGGDYPVTITIA
jgi:hypothetical protein